MILGGKKVIKSRIIWLLSSVGAFAFLFFSDQGMALLLFLSIIIVPMMFILENQIAARHIGVTMEMPPISSKNEPFTVRFVAGNRRGFLFSLVQCRMCFRNEVTGERTNGGMMFPLGGRKSHGEVSFLLNSQLCGSTSLEENSVQIYDIFGLASVKKKIMNEKETIVLPNTFSPQLEITTYKSKDIEADEYSQIKSGFDPSETFAIRSYQPGDSLNRIHWKLSEKFDDILIRESGLPVKHSFFVLLETALHSSGEKEPQVDDALLEIMVSLCQKMSEEGISFDVGWEDYQTRSFFRCNIGNLDDLSGIVNKLMHTSYQKDDSDGATYFWESCGEASFEHIIYVSRFFSESMQKYGEEAKVTAIICNNDSEQTGNLKASNLDVCICTPENYEKELYVLAI